MKKNDFVSVNIDVSQYFSKLNSPEVNQDIGNKVVVLMKDMIASGQSPVTGDRFEPYKAVGNQRALLSEAKRAGKLAGIARSEGDHKSHNFHSQAQRDLKSAAGATQKGYPYSVMSKFADKTITPVNLYLSGLMLSFLKAVSRNNSLEIGYIDAPDEVTVYAEAHNEGPTNGMFAQRRTIPTKDGEEFTTSIMRRIKDLYSQALSDIIGKSK